ncbi:MAG: hypothetical protein GTO41_27040, partial [Burkholderiales bacterium]|nr:hypothetical protein [Burkholderiales bacterium]
KGDKFVLWRDFTKAERVQMGEIVDARYTVAKTFALLAKNISTGKFFKDIAENKEWTWLGPGKPPDETIAERGSALRHYVGYEWVLVP